MQSSYFGDDPYWLRTRAARPCAECCEQSTFACARDGEPDDSQRSAPCFIARYTMPLAMADVSIGEVVDALGGSYSGDRTRRILRVRTLAEAGPEDLTFLSNPRYAHLLDETAAGAVIVDRRIAGDSERWIRVDEPYFALSVVLKRWFTQIPVPASISADARISSSARIGSDVRIGSFAVIGDDAFIGDGVVIYEGAYVGAGCQLGNGTIIYPNVTVYYGTVIGSRCIVHAGAVIGGDGFGFATKDGRHHKIPQVGIVRIEDDVEIGAGTTIDRAALGETVIGEGTKIDNLVQIGHNVKIGAHCLLVAQSAVAGSAELGAHTIMGGQSGVAGHLRLGAGVQVGAQAAVMKDVDGPVTLSGSPARPVREYLKGEALVRRLPEIMTRLEKLERQLSVEGDGLASGGEVEKS